MRREVRGLKPALHSGGSQVPRRGAACCAPTLRPAGFTLVEVMVALTIGAVVVLLAHELFGAVAERGRRLTVVRTALDRSANARRWLDATFLSLDVGTDGAGGFDGGPDHAAFASWLLTPDGWFERRTVSLARNNDRLVASVAPGQPIALMDSVAELALDYLLEPGAESRWVREWVSPVGAPVAVRMRIEKAGCPKGLPVGRGMRDARCMVDTLLFLIKERG
jgi:prepilin-type N-terminal cleavage/methylation domain-containing protein